MLSQLIFAATLLPAIALACEGTKPVTVRFDHPENFTDFRVTSLPNDAAREHLASELARHLEREAAGRLEPGNCLAIVVTNVDMAGQFEPWRSPRSADIRVVRDAYPPRIKLAFRLTDDEGKLLKEAARNLTDMNFLNGPRIYRDDPLGAEKALLDSWLRREFAR